MCGISLSPWSTPLVITCCCLITRYVEVDEDNGTELFYYFVESEAGGENAPFLLWLTGGDHCSVLSGLAFEIGTFCLRSQVITLYVISYSDAYTCQPQLQVHSSSS